MGRALALILACVAGCYQSPSLASCKYRCGGANNTSCPNGFECNGGMCVAPGDQCDSDGGVIDMGDDPDTLIDMMTVDAPQCADPNMNFWSPMPTLSTSSSLDQIVVFDGNNDNKLDIAVLDESDAFGFFAGNGDGTFGLRQPSTSGASSKRMITGDFNRDGQRDDIIVMQSGSTNAMAIMTSNGNGTFTRTGGGIGPNGVDIGNAGDVDGNGREDVLIAFTESGNPHIEVILQTDTDPFWMQGTTVATNSMASSMFVGRVNAGGSTDAVVTMSSQIGFHYASGNNPFTLDTHRVANVANPVRAIAANIRPAPAAPTIVVVSSSAGVVLQHVSGLFTMTPGGEFSVGNNPKAVIAANLIGDPLPEVVTADSGSGGVSILHNLFASNMDFALPPTTLTTGNNPVDLVAGDFDADGRLDLAVANKGAQNVTVFLNKCTP
jgi:hypothetical protein